MAIIQSEEFRNKKIVITGGSSGVGAAMTHAFARAGATVFISGRRAAALSAVAGAASNIHTFTGDMTKEDDVKSLFAAAGADGRPADIVIANAGTADSAPLERTSTRMWQDIIALNLTGTFYCLREGLAEMKRAGVKSGRLIAVASMTAKRSYPYISAYAASKHGVLGLVRSAALETARLGITVNAICPGYLDTEMTRRSVQNIMDKTGLSRDEAEDRLKIFSPQGRLFTADEVVQTALFLASDAAGGINGQALSIDGGETW